MELPFKYIVLCIIETLNERNMPLIIGKNTLVDYISAVVENLFFTLEEKKELGNNFDFQYELDDLLNKYYKYFVLTEDDNIKACKLYQKYADRNEQVLFSNKI